MLLCRPTPAVQAQSPNTDQAIDRYVTAQVRDAHIPGLALGIVHPDGRVHVRGFGAADPAGQSVTPDTPFVIGSLSKSFTALAVMQLVEQGKLDLDAPVQRYVPWFTTADASASGTITPRQLLNQTSGIPKSAVKDLQASRGEETIDQAVRRLSLVHLASRVGTTYQYSNMNYVTLGSIIQTVSGEPYENYIERHIFQPLGMHHSFAAPPVGPEAALATPYRWVFGVPVPGELPFNRSILPAGYLVSSAEDLTHYLTAQLYGGRYAGHRLLSPDGIDAMHRPVADMGVGGEHYAMGWVSSQADGRTIVWHEGTPAFGFEGYMLLVPDHHIAVVVLANAYSSGVADVVDPIESIALSVAGQLDGANQTPATVNIATGFALFDGIALLSLVLAVWSLVRLVRGRKRPLFHGPVGALGRAVLPLLWELLLPMAILVLLILPLLGPLDLMLLAAPDVTGWLLGLSAVLLLTGITRVILAFANYRAPRTFEGACPEQQPLPAGNVLA